MALLLDVSPLRESRDFRWLFTGRCALLLGGALTETAAGWQLYGLTGSTVAVGLGGLVTSLGMIAGLLLGGMLADRVDRRALLTAVRLPGALFALALLGNSLLDSPRLWLIYVSTTAIGFLAGLGAPATYAAVPALVGVKRLAAVAALNGLTTQSAALLGPALAGYLIAGPGLVACFAVDAAGFALFAVAMRFVRPLPPSTPAPTRPGLRSMAEGFRYVRGNQIVAGVMLVDAVAMLCAAPKSLFPALATDWFGGDATTFGLLSAAPAAGAIAAAATSGWTSRVRLPGMVALIATAIWGLAIAGLGLTHALFAGMALLALSGAADLVSEILRGSLLQAHTPDGLRGRVTSLWLAQTNGAPAFGSARAGVVAQVAGLPGALIGGGLACVLGLGIVALRLREFRRVRG
ncbi:MFS transporter [Phytomonospora sp. NPDC050363]|uniref:MFS transporter n=1 Tax=Phytomonospora sp. NPDC050363 TaxID=3155642 RepID=UPI0033F3EEC1